MIFLIVGKLSAQQLDHRQGIISVQLEKSAEIEVFVSSLEYFKKVKTDAKVEKFVSTSFQIWNIQFDHNLINEIDFLDYIRRSPKIVNAQFDFFIESRTEPDDPWYFLQYHLKNNGQNGGTAGVDLDMEIAWDVTTGGESFFGDEIVLCIIDENFDFQHNDLNENSWINHDEIPGDSIDNDENGYIDDYYGWNVTTFNDDIDNGGYPGNHGTQVAGIAGAEGNNSLGISGVNWNVKMMYVTRGYTFSDAVAAYTYPFEARKKYNETNGSQGAFVVATNSSWGVDYGMPNDAPLWCGIYDSLGSVGILNAAATANLDINVDESGDLPTTCPSDFLVTTTKVDNNDQIPQNAGYGVESIDLAAFGKDVFTTEANNLFGILSGTSAAAPQVAGAIALMYSAPCPSFISLAKNQPEAASLLVKDYILNGTEPNLNLEGITLSEGRLNIANSLQLLMDDCNYSGCYPPYSIVFEDIDEASVTIDWQLGVTSTSVNIRYREIGSSTWLEINDISNPYTLSGLIACTNYEFQLGSECGSLTSDFSLSYDFQTTGCCHPPLNFEVNSIEENQIVLGWEEVETANLYRVRYREVNTSTWNVVYLNNVEVTIPSLDICTDYEFQIQSICNGQNSVYTESIIATTLGCSNCLELPYCDLSATEMSFVWIKEVSLSNLDHISQNSLDGYSDHTDLTVDLIQGQNYELSLVSESDLEPFAAIFNVWIDFNQDGYFNNFDELILHSSSSEIVSNKFIYVPTSAYTGSTRMRVSFMEENTTSCGSEIYVGEVEDYCVNIEEPTECLPPTNISFETGENSISINWYGNLFTESYLLKYREVVDTNWIYLECPSDQVFINNLIACTDYEFQIHSVCDGEPGIPTQLFHFTTKGCSVCLDYDYCFENNANASFEWIHSLKIGAIHNVSGPDDGYAHFQEYTTDLIIGNDYQLEIVPGFSTNQYEEYYMVWLDFNHDGSYGFNEVVFDSNGPTNGSIQTMISIPDNISNIGSTRMRVTMKYQSPPASACDYDFFGEIEEYCVNIVENGYDVCVAPEGLTVDSIAEFSAIFEWDEIEDAHAYTIRYQPKDSINSWKYINTYDNHCGYYQLEECVTYLCQVRAICESGLSVFSEMVEFQTECTVVSSFSVNDFSTAFNLYPNPTKNEFFIDFELAVPSKIQFELFDVQGKKIETITESFTGGKKHFKMEFPEHTPAGVYYIRVTEEGQFKATVLKVIRTF